MLQLDKFIDILVIFQAKCKAIKKNYSNVSHVCI